MFLMERPYILEKKSVLFMKNVRTFLLKIYPKGPKNGRTVQMNCESVNSDF